MSRDALVQIRAPHFVAGVVVQPGGNFCAPIVRYMRTWSLPAIRDYCEAKGWQLEIVRDHGEPGSARTDG